MISFSFISYDSPNILLCNILAFDQNLQGNNISKLEKSKIEKNGENDHI